MEKQHDFKEPRILLLLTAVILLGMLLFYCIASLITSVGYQTFAEAEESAQATLNSTQHKCVIILDAGHGGEDPGAVANGLQEKNLNLAIATKLAAFLELSGHEVLLTRKDDRLLYRPGEENRKKYYDLYHRLQIAEGRADSIFVSIHINKFPSESCKGLQTFYSLNHPDSKLLAQAIQSAAKLAMPDNTRTVKSDNRTIFLLKELHSPAVLIECGFLSNRSDAEKLADPYFQDQLAFSLYCGVSMYLEVQDA